MIFSHLNITSKAIKMNKVGFYSYVQNFLLLISTVIFISNAYAIEKTADQQTEENRFIVSGTVTKKGDRYYLSRSVQDYYINFCESNISLKQFTSYLEKLTGFIKSVTLEVEYRPINRENQCQNEADDFNLSGKYIIIHKIITNK